MSAAPLVIALPDGTQAWYVAGSGLRGRAQCVTADGVRYPVQIPVALADTWHWNGSVLVRVSGEALATWDYPPPHCFRQARRIEAGYQAAHAPRARVVQLPKRAQRARTAA